MYVFSLYLAFYRMGVGRGFTVTCMRSTMAGVDLLLYTGISVVV